MSSKSNLLKGQASSKPQTPKAKEVPVEVRKPAEEPKEVIKEAKENIQEGVNGIEEKEVIKEAEVPGEVSDVVTDGSTDQFGGILDNAEEAEDSVFFINSSEQAIKAEMADITNLPDKHLTKELESRESTKSKEGIISELKRRKGLSSTASIPKTPSEVLKQRTAKLTPLQELERRRKGNVNG